MAFLLVHRFPMFSLASAVDTMRSANQTLGREFYRWTTVSFDGEPVMASNGMKLNVDYSLRNTPSNDIAFVCAGTVIDFPEKAAVLAALHRWGRRGWALGALTLGSHVLAEAGQLDRHRCTIHWENRAAFQERFPTIECTGNVYEIDRKRYTSAGGTTSMDLFLEIIRRDLGPTIANEVAGQFQHERVRSPSDRQRVGPGRDLASKSVALRKVIELMAENLEDPISVVSLAKTGGMSVRQLERLFSLNVNMTPGRYYITLRLERARALLRQTPMSILSVALATGFASQSYFARSYRLQFGYLPSDERRPVA
ncbi:GlxA family transcriptional regulator [Mesorhizobium sp. B2-4-14]|uniref:GlxA family transcriptional regulator n=1 Tax=Mesorhizobium sp. B2-4-14 TaxID=2589935 RepID=UPI001127DE69|nr:GlxA family transcriptional regulator [Mesorhizobium sp. B2-4-14]TPK96497.1 GlxA family transcriptional regulator [Mesorhizobium sp. B2-4-14]